MKIKFNYNQYWQDVKNRADNKTLAVEEYDKLVSKADWFYYFSDSNLSPLEMNTLFTIATEGSNEFKSLYNREHAKRFNNESFYPASDARKYTPPFSL
jgi:hypothetical protein